MTKGVKIRRRSKKVKKNYVKEWPTRTSRIERSCLQYLSLLWSVRQSGATFEHNDVKLTLGLLSKQHSAHTPMSHVSLVLTKVFATDFGLRNTHGFKHFELQKLNSFSTSPLVLSSCKRCISCLTQLWPNGLGQWFSHDQG